MKVVKNCIGLFITLPIWYYLLYSILSAIHPDRLVWFLYWIYVPAGIILGVLDKMTAKEDARDWRRPQ